MALESGFKNGPPIDPSKEIDISALKGQGVVITGGASGLGEAFTRKFVEAGAYVTIGDVDEVAGPAVAKALGEKVHFVRCDTRVWEDQVALFKAALKHSPTGSIDIVLANAGISGPDSVYATEDSEEPVKPDLKILDINLIGNVYTSKLALHYFSRQQSTADKTRLLILTSSLAGYLDQPGSPQYTMSKYGCRAFMRSLRHTLPQRNIRVNTIAPWFIRTSIISNSVFDHLASRGIEFALIEDAVAAVMNLSVEQQLNGRAVTVVPRSFAPHGYMDLRQDEYPEGSMFAKMQELVLNASYRTVAPNHLQ